MKSSEIGSSPVFEDCQESANGGLSDVAETTVKPICRESQDQNEEDPAWLELLSGLHSLLPKNELSSYPLSNPSHSHNVLPHTDTPNLHLEALHSESVETLAVVLLWRLERDMKGSMHPELVSALQRFIVSMPTGLKDSVPEATPSVGGTSTRASVAAVSAKDCFDLSPSTVQALSPARRAVSLLETNWLESAFMQEAGERTTAKHHTAGIPLQQDWDRTVYISWIPRVARAHTSSEKPAKQYALRSRLRSCLGVVGLEKVLLFPPRGNHAKLIFETRESAAAFLDSYGGTAASPKTREFKLAICNAYGIGALESIWTDPLLAESLEAASVKIEWCFTRDFISQLKAAQKEV